MLSAKDVLLSPPVAGLLNFTTRNDHVRGAIMKVAERKLYGRLVEENPYACPLRVQEDKFYVVRNMMYSLDRALRDGAVSPQVKQKLLRIFVGKIFSEDVKARMAFKEEHGASPPSFLLLSPGKRCNLRCIGCYASSSRADAEKLDYDLVDRIMTEKTELWHSHFTVISGGEPTMWRSQGKGILDLAHAHPDNFFLMYTNGTLINEAFARELAEVGNITPAISVEGFEKETDARRGEGTHRKIREAFGNLKKAGVPFGISVTATRFNAEQLMSDAFIDYYFEEQGALYGWIFQYMPIGRKFTLDLMVTPEQRAWMYEREQRLIRERKIFMADFWNSGALSDGCISAGRGGGYFYIDWNGDCAPCAFFPYATHNIVEVYKNGGDLNTVLQCPFFQGVRKWQSEYSYQKPADQVGNQIVPCVTKDHHRVAHEAVKRFGAYPLDKAGAEALEDEGYYEGMVAYGKEVARLTDPIWERDYIGPERMREVAMQAAS